VPASPLTLSSWHLPSQWQVAERLRIERAVLVLSKVIGSSGERYVSAIAEAFERLKARDIQLTASNSGGSVSDNRVTVRVLNRTAVVDLRAGTVAWDDGTAPEDTLKVILLHYLLGADGRIDGEWMSFREFESGNLYYSVFHGRALVQLISAFGSDPARLVAPSVKLGGTRVERGDVSFDFLFFPNLKMNITIWKGDDEVPASANILFDAAAGRILGAEDLAHLAEDIAETLERLAT